MNFEENNAKSQNYQRQNQYDLSQYTYMPGTASLIEDIDKQLMVILRDGRTLIGYLRSIDQYANLLLSSTIERIHVGTKYGDIPRGIYMIRGENVVLTGEVDFSIPLKVNMIKVSVQEILELQQIEKRKQEEAEKLKKKALMERCLISHSDAILDEYY
jgi:U6 snRNA-associated Sm-like protein LSm1